uniref:DNA helicase MCM9 n=1 Tax=Monopterus albus TaxID=43700 RepID=A0A3Q3IRE9_MONAL|nr:DNA helicase MCM9 [Monopterus albus]
MPSASKRQGRRRRRRRRRRKKKKKRKRKAGSPRNVVGLCIPETEVEVHYSLLCGFKIHSGFRSPDLTMLISPEEEALIDQVFEIYLAEHHHGDILRLITDANEETHYSVVVNAMTLFDASMEVGDYFNAYPNDVLAIFDKVLNRTATELSKNGSSKHFGGRRTKEHGMRHILHVRITGLPLCPEMTRDTIPRSRDVEHFLSVTGIVIRSGVAKVLEYERDYMCAKCRHVFTVQADFDQFYTFVPPTTCPNPDGCNSYKFSCLSGGSEPAVCRDYQEIKIQEQVQKLSVGSIPRSMVVVLEDDLVDSCKSGDEVTVYGVMCQRWKPFYDGTCCDVELVLKANNVEVNNQQPAAALLMKDVQKEFDDFWNSYKHDPIAGRNQILLSLCPQVFGMYVIKLAVAMVLAGGVQRIDSSGTKIRGECHMLLVGDPGTAKSQFLKYAAKIMPHSVLTAGIGSTSAGLTVAAVKDGGDWHLEAGALVLSDGGLCCIDEFNSIKEHDRISIHEAMEQQSISVAKAGMVCKLNTRTSILAATNPKGQYDPNEPLSVNVALASPLLSRFDLVLVLLDTRNTEWDRIISSFILKDRGLPADSASLWSMEKLKAYFSVIKKLQPQVSEEANSILTRYYQLQRQKDGRNAARTTIRMLESLSRLAEAHARLMYRETVTIEDAVMAVSVMECSMQGGALLGNTNALLTSFPADPSQQYQTQCQILLEGLNLPLHLQKELDRLARLKRNHSEASEFDPLADEYQQQLSDTSFIIKTHHRDITSNCKFNVTGESGFDWFHSITPSVSPDDMNSPIITSTQENLDTKPKFGQSQMSIVIKQSNRQTEDIPSNSDAVSDPYRKITSTLEDKDRKSEKNEKEKSGKTHEQVKQSEKQKDKQHSESLGCVLQKVSKNLRHRRIRELKNQQRTGHGERVVSVDAASIDVTDVLDTASDSHSSRTLLSTKNCPSISLVHNLSSGKESIAEEDDRRGKTETKCFSSVLREKMAAQPKTREDLHAVLSGFKFKARKVKPSVTSFNTSSNVTELQSEYNPGVGDHHTYTEIKICKQKLVSHDDSTSPLTVPKRGEIQNQSLLEGVNDRKQVSRVSEVGGGSGSENSTGFAPKELNNDVFYIENDKLSLGGSVNRRKGSDDRENLHQQRTRVNTADETEVEDFTESLLLNSSTCIGDPALSKSGHTNSAVASSTLAKLARFSFTCMTEPMTTAPKKLEENPPAKVGKSSFTRDGAECSRANATIKKTPSSPEHCPLKKIKTVVDMDKVKDLLPPPAAEVTLGQKYDQGTELPAKTKLEPAHEANQRNCEKMVNDYERTVNLKKRKCFELGSLPSSAAGTKGPFSGLSLFGSVELSNDVFDTDWDQEVSKKAKV